MDNGSGWSCDGNRHCVLGRSTDDEDGAVDGEFMDASSDERTETSTTKASDSICG